MASDVSEAEPDQASAGEDKIAAIAERIIGLSNGDRALLRRLYLVQASSSRSHQADGVVIGLLRAAALPVPGDAEAFGRWRLIAHVAALLSGTGRKQPHASKRHVGTALHEAGYSEKRLLRLTAARGAPLADQIVRAARVIAQGKAMPVNLWTLFDLAGPDPVRAEQARLDIARRFYAAASAGAKTGDPK